jgi:ABC-type glycerol-3-phosphate transport system substrate-binding protein
VEPNFEYVPSGDIRDTINTRLSAGDAPDVIFTSVSYHAQFGLRGNLRDLSGIVPDNVPDSARMAIDGRDVYVPANLQMCSEWYRQDLYEEAGIEWATTWDEALHNYEVLDEYLPDDQDATLYIANSSHPYMIYGHYHPMLSNGSQFIDRDSTDEAPYPVIGEEPYRTRAIEYLEFLEEAYQYSPESVNYGYGEATELFYTERVADTKYPARAFLSSYRENPEMAEHVAMGRFPDTPAMQAGEAEYTIAGVGEGFAVPTTDVGADNPSLGESYVEYFMGSDYYIDFLLSVPLHRVPADLSILDTDKYQSNEVVQAMPAYVDYVKEMAERARFYTVLTGRDTPTTYWDPLIRGTQIGTEFLAEPMVGRIEPEAAVDRAHRRLEEQIPQFEERFSGE